MNSTAAQVEGFRVTFRRRRRVVIMITIGFILFLLLRVLVFRTMFGVGSGGWMAITLVLTSLIVVLEHRLWRCPSCNASLDHSFNPARCDACGLKLRH